MENNFKVLTSKEEKKLTVEELKDYYKELREYLLERKLTNCTKGIETVAPKLIKPTAKVAESLTRMLTSKDVDWVCDGLENIPEGSCIFAYTHQGMLDNFIWIPFLDKHCPILHGAGVNKVLIFSQLNTGLIFVEKGNKENNNNAKLDMIRLLLKGHSITYFPEGTWNLSPNKLHLPLSYGFLDTARKADVPVVPCVHEFTYDSSNEKGKILKIHSRYGKPIYITEEDNILEKLEEYKESISTIRYDLIEEKGMFKREDTSNIEYINFLKSSYKDLKLGKLNLEKERKYIFGGDDDFYKYFNINDVPFDDENNLLETEETLKLKRINEIHKI